MTTEELLKKLGWGEDLVKAHHPAFPDVIDKIEDDCDAEVEIIASSDLTLQFESAVLAAGTILNVQAS